MLACRGRGEPLEHPEGNYKSRAHTELTPATSQSSPSSSLILSLSSGEFSEINLTDNLFPPPSPNPLLPSIVSKFVSSSTHSALITTTGYLYFSNPQPTLFNSSFCRIKFFDDLYENGEKVTDVALTSGHTVVLTSLNKVFTFGNNVKRLNLYPASSSSSNNHYSQDLYSLVPISVSVKNRTSSISPPNSASLSNGNNFSALSALNSFATLDSNAADANFSFKGVAASNNHTVVYSKLSLHIHGLNLGQFGPLTNSIQSSNKQSEKNQSFSPAGALSAVASSAHSPWKYGDDPIQQVVALDLATLVITQSSLIHVYVAGLHVKISLPFNKDLKDSWNKFKPRVLSMPRKIVKMVAPLSVDHFSGEKAISSSAGNLNSTYSVLTLLDSGEVYVFTFPRYSTSKDSLKESVKFTLIWNPARTEMRATDVSVGALETNNITGIGAVLCTQSGEAFKRTKAKWVRVNDVSKIKHVAVGYGFPIIGSFSTDDNPFKTILLRQEDKMLKHEILPSRIITDFAKLSPLQGRLGSNESVAPKEAAGFDVDFFSSCKYENTDTYGDYDSDSSDAQLEDISLGIIFEKHINPLTYKHSRISHVPFLDSEASFNVSMGLQELVDKSFPHIEAKFDNFYDYEITVKNLESDTQLSLLVHKKFLFNRLGFKHPTYSLERKDLKFDFNESSATIIGDVDVRNVALFLHMLYTDVSYDIWNSSDEASVSLKAGWDRLLYSFPTVNLVKAIRATFTDDNTGDITVKLLDGDITTYRYLLSCRCDYFKQYFTEFWSQSDVIDFSHISKYTWNLVMNYLRGDSNDEIFYSTVKELVKSCSKKVSQRYLNKKKSSRLFPKELEETGLISSDDFVNIVLEVLYFSNELLLPSLRELCELAIKDCINFDNYDIFLQHAFISGSKQLFANCGWFIFNNLTLCYKDQRLNANIIGDDCACALEAKIHELVEVYIPERKKLKQNSTLHSKQSSSKKKLLIINQNEPHDTASFIRNTEQFNEYYLHPYLWDEHGILEDQITLRTPMNRRKSQTSVLFKNLRSSSTSLNSTIDSTDLKQEGNLPHCTSGLASRSSSSESAISDDLNDLSDGFIVVQKARRKSSSIPTLGNTGRSYSSSLIRPPFDPNTVRRESSGSIFTSKSVLNANEPWKILKSGTSSADKSVSASSDMGINSVGSSTTTLDEILTQSKSNTKQDTRVKSKITAPLRISQKERKLREREESEKAAKDDGKKSEKVRNNSKAPWAASSVWGMNAPRVVGNSDDPVDAELPSGIIHAELNTATLLASNKMNTAHFPSLEELRSVKVKGKVANDAAFPVIGSSSGTTLSNDSRHYDGLNGGMSSSSSLTLAAVPNTGTTKSLEEIREEEEFAKWWKEESERVQRELQQSEDTNIRAVSSRGGGRRDSNSNSNSNSFRGNRGNRGNRGGRARGTNKNRGRGGRGKSKVGNMYVDDQVQI
ncbi:hypothetical protein PMKS-003919 [Pichia membranifaciens]|uniref:BTB domain-containing protein n=1 Tax=Pichia membranifaciens TaxID=4926 RepID=A0A1Q2YLI2_9ASCO|nr:hypothetical protein PMKS-003919 [Pichia membranifaciens]